MMKVTSVGGLPYHHRQRRMIRMVISLRKCLSDLNKIVDGARKLFNPGVFVMQRQNLLERLHQTIVGIVKVVDLDHQALVSQVTLNAL
jgi:hypothetical protein